MHKSLRARLAGDPDFVGIDAAVRDFESRLLRAFSTPAVAARIRNPGLSKYFTMRPP